MIRLGSIRIPRRQTPRERRPTRPALWLAACALAVATRANAQDSAHGPPFRINTYTLGDQRDAGASVDGDGRFVVVWQSVGSTGTDGDGTSIQRRRYDAKGEPLGDEQQVNALTTGAQLLPQVASDPQGGFVVVWQSAVSGATDTDGYSIQARRFDADGNPLGGQFQVNTGTKGDQTEPAIASDESGNFVVAWTSVPSSSSGGAYGRIFAQRFVADGTPAGAELAISSFTKVGLKNPAVACSPWGDFVVTWLSEDSPGTDTSSTCILARRFLADGTPKAADFQVNTYTRADQRFPAVAVDGSGAFVVAWQGFLDAPGYTNDGIHARQFAADGSPRADEFAVSAVSPFDRSRPKIAIDSGGNFAILWVSDAWYPPYPAASIQARRFRESGEPLGDEFQASTYAFGSASSPAVASDPDGNFVVAWFRDHATGTDFDGEDVQGQLFDALFRDDFDDGSLARWSATFP